LVVMVLVVVVVMMVAMSVGLKDHRTWLHVVERI